MITTFRPKGTMLTRKANRSCQSPRVDFYHWVMIDLPASMNSISEGEYSNGITARGKNGPDTLHSARHGINDYTGWFASDKDMSGDYYGYDGPCPPWNDSIPHITFSHFMLWIRTNLSLSDRFTRSGCALGHERTHSGQGQHDRRLLPES